MAEREGREGSRDGLGDPFFVNAPSITLPKGGGAIRGIGEKVAANPVTGTGTMSVPIATSPGRSAFGPQLTLTYDSGTGNGIFGVGWTLGLPAITRKTDKGLPRYADTRESDVFQIAGAEDLVPLLVPPSWQRETPQTQTIAGVDYNVFAYRPRIEGLFARIERWTSRDGRDTFWRSISRDNVTTLYGRTLNARVVDPADPTRVYTWLISESSDDKGNVVVYEYQREDRRNVDAARGCERNRGAASQLPDGALANTHIKRIKYGNTPSRLVEPDTSRLEWHIEVVFDYGEGHYQEAAPDGDGRVFVTTALPQAPEGAAWPVRSDPFSACRAGFEVRTYRLCQRVLVFHRFDALGVEPVVVRSTDFRYASSPSFSFLTAVTHSAYAPFETGLLKKSVPPVEFGYSTSPSQTALVKLPIEIVDADSVENLPVGIGSTGYQWIDLDGEGVAGVLLEHAGAWHYKRNLGGGRFAPVELVLARPTVAERQGRQLVDLNGDGRLDVVVADGAMTGFVERTPDESWGSFRPLPGAPTVGWTDPDVRLVDLTGDGLADLVISEQEAFLWHRSLGADGFAPAHRTPKSLDEEDGPRLVFSDGTDTVFLADMSGDGLVDLVRIRNGEVSYWPNIGYGRFGARVSMDRAPWFDLPDRFDPKRLRLADVDGSGVTDIIYLHPDAPVVYFNQSGNGWSEGQSLPQFPRIDDESTVRVVDLLGTGTACLVWSSPLPGAANAPLQYLDLMASSKPHLLVSVTNNMGATTTVEYAASTRFYLADRAAGRPWVTRLPFPVHVVTRVSVRDEWRGTTFSNTYSYHHGYFDGHEREFRGFGRIERVDAEDFGTFADANANSPYVTADSRLFQPPVKTVTWTHLGAALDREQVLAGFRAEYFPQMFPHPAGFDEKTLEAVVLPEGLNGEEWREALRACKGTTLRVEVYELDVRALAEGRERPVRLLKATERNCRISRLQPRQDNPYSSFLRSEEEALDYHYELALPSTAGDAVSADPRISHTLTLRRDELGNVQQRVTVGYGRVRPGEYAAYPRTDLIDAVQAEVHAAYEETRFTNDCITRFDSAAANSPIEHYRLRRPCEVRSYELTGLRSPASRYFDIDELRRHALCEDATYPPDVPAGSAAIAVASLAYHEQPHAAGPSRRVSGRVRTLYFDDASSTAAPSQPLPFGQVGPRAMPYEVYRLALTAPLLDAVLQRRDSAGQPVDALLDWIVDPTTTPPISARSLLETPAVSGYVAGAALDAALAGQYWIRSGIAGFDTDAAAHFFLPTRYSDAFGNSTALTYDALDLFASSRTDPAGNRTRVERFDYRVLAPIEMGDVNGNHVEVRFDALGLVVAAAEKGKNIAGAWQGDHLDDLADAIAEPPPAAVAAFCTAATFDGDQARRWLASASHRFLYHFGESRDANGIVTAWAARKPAACDIQRERHASAVPPGSTLDPVANPLQVTLECSDGAGHVLMKKVQAEPDPDVAPAAALPRWIINGLQVVNNKGNTVKAYEPSFSPSFGDEPPPAQGVTTVTFYDAVDRQVRVEYPDGTFSRAAFSPWHVERWDRNDTALDSRWYDARNQLNPAAPLARDLAGRITAPPEQRAGWLVAQHDGTSSITLLDSLARDVIGIVHNRVKDPAGPLTYGGESWRDDYTLTFTKLDGDGRPLWIRDARGNLVTQHLAPVKPISLPADPSRWLAAEEVPAASVRVYSVTGTVLYQHSMDAGDRWMLPDAANQPLFGWDFNDRVDDTGVVISEGRLLFARYDALRRPCASQLLVNGQAALVEASDYADTAGTSPATLADLQNRNLIGQAVHHWDPSGLTAIDRVNFQGQVEEIARTLVADPTAAVVDWNVPDRSALVEDASETFRQLADYDALGRLTRLCNWHRDDAGPGASSRVAVYLPAYNARGLLESEILQVQASKSVGADGRPLIQANADPAKTAPAIRFITYNARGQTLALRLGNGTTTRCNYDPQTFRLTRLYTRRDARFPNDCHGDPDAADPARPCGVQNLRYTYDPVGNVTHIQDDAQDTVWFNNQQVEPSSDFTYDALYRLVEAEGRENAAAVAPPPHPEGPWPRVALPSPDVTRNYTERYAYDAVGNLVTLQHIAARLPGEPDGSWTRRYTVKSDSNRLDQTWYGTDTVNAVTYRHDVHGNLLNFDRTAPGFDVRWDWRDQIRALDLEGGGHAYYNYGADKRRTRKRLVRAGGVEDRITLEGYELYRRFDPLGAVIEQVESLHVFNGSQRVLLVDDVQMAAPASLPSFDDLTLQQQTLFRYQYADHQGSVTTELDAESRVISHEEFRPYGACAYRMLDAAREVPAKRYRYIGDEHDGESGLDYHLARYYSSSLVRWTACDPSGLVDGPNVYEYARSNPVAMADWTGRQGTSSEAWREARESGLSFAGGIYGAGKSLVGGFVAVFNLGYYSMAYDIYAVTGASAYREPAAEYERSFWALGALTQMEPSDIAKGYVKARGDAVLSAIDRGDAFAASEASGETLMDLYMLASAARGSNPRFTSSLAPAMTLQGDTAVARTTLSALGPKNSALGLYVMSSAAGAATTQEIDRQRAREVTRSYLQDQGVSRVKDLSFKAYWNLMEKLGVETLIRELGVLVYEQIHLFEGTVEKGRSVMTDLGRIPDALLVDPSTGKMAVSEFTAMKDIPAGSVKFQQMSRQLSAFERARAGTSTIWARLPNETFIEVTDAVQTLGDYPHWDASNVNELAACFK